MIEETNWKCSVRKRPIRLGPCLRRVRQVDQQAGIHVKPHAEAVQGHRRHVAQGAELRLLGARTGLLGIGGLDVGRRAEIHLARVAVDNDRIALLDISEILGMSLTAGTDSARATIAIWLDAPPSSSTRPRSRARS